MEVNVMIYFLHGDGTPDSKVVMGAPYINAVIDKVEDAGGIVLQADIATAEEIEAAREEDA